MVFGVIWNSARSGALTEELDRKAIRTKRQFLTTGRARVGYGSGVGTISHLLHNRFYIVEVAHGEGIHPGRRKGHVRGGASELTETLSTGCFASRIRLRSSWVASSTTVVTDDPDTHEEARCAVRILCITSLLRNQHGNAGSVPRVPAHEIEALASNLTSAIMASMLLNDPPIDRTPRRYG